MSPLRHQLTTGGLAGQEVNVEFSLTTKALGLVNVNLVRPPQGDAMNS